MTLRCGHSSGPLTLVVMGWLWTWLSPLFGVVVGWLPLFFLSGAVMVVVVVVAVFVWMVVWVRVSDLGQTNNPNTTQTKDYEKESGGVPLWYQRGFTYGKGDASTPKRWCRCRQRALLMTRSDRRQRGSKTGAFLKALEVLEQTLNWIDWNSTTTPGGWCSK